MGLGRGLGRGFKSIGGATARGLKYVEQYNPVVRGVKMAVGANPDRTLIDPDRMSNRDKQILGAFAAATPGGWGPIGMGYAGQAINKLSGNRKADNRVAETTMALPGMKRKLGS